MSLEKSANLLETNDSSFQLNSFIKSARKPSTALKLYSSACSQWNLYVQLLLVSLISVCRIIVKLEFTTLARYVICALCTDASDSHMYLLSQLSRSVLASWMLGLSAGLMSSLLR